MQAQAIGQFREEPEHVAHFSSDFVLIHRMTLQGFLVDTVNLADLAGQPAQRVVETLLACGLVVLSTTGKNLIFVKAHGCVPPYF